MKIIEPSYCIEAPDPFDADAIMCQLERAARTCYKSEDKIGPGTADKFIRGVLKRGQIMIPLRNDLASLLPVIFEKAG